MSQPGRLDTEDDSAVLPFWSGKPRFFWFVLVSSAILLLVIFPFQLFQILSFGDIVASPGWLANASPSGWIVGYVQPSGPVGGKLSRGDKLLAIDGDPRAARIGTYRFLNHKAPGERYTVDVHQRTTSSGSARTSLLITHDKDMLYRLEPRIIMLDAGRILFDGTYEAFRHSNSPVIQPYFELMPKLHQRLEGSVDPAAQQAPS